MMGGVRSSSNDHHNSAWCMIAGMGRRVCSGGMRWDMGCGARMYAWRSCRGVCVEQWDVHRARRTTHGSRNACMRTCHPGQRAVYDGDVYKAVFCVGPAPAI